MKLVFIAVVVVELGRLNFFLDSLGLIGYNPLQRGAAMAMKLLCVNSSDVARMLNVDRTTVWRYIQRGLLSRISAGSYALIPLFEVAHQLGITFEAAMQMSQQHMIKTYYVWMEVVD